MKRPEVVRGHIRANVPALNGAGILIESEVDPAKHPRVVDVVCKIVERLVREEDAWNARMRQLEANVMPPQKALGDLTRGVTG